MNRERLNFLYKQYQAKRLTPEERVEWRSLVGDSNFNEDLEEIIGAEWYAYTTEEWVNMDTAKADQMFGYITSQPQERIKTRRLWPSIAVAVSVAIAVMTGGYFYYSNKDQASERTYANDIKPGGNRAFLTLGNGKRISITDALNGDIATENGVKITKSANGEIIYTASGNADKFVIDVFETPRGGTSQVILPDGTHVWLNAESSLKYPSSFASLKDRKVELNGEAYFEVSKDRSHPFIVRTNKQEVEVLGTHFNINSYTDNSSIKTTLLEGSVKVSTADLTETLTPGQQATLTGNRIQVAAVETEDVVAWKNGYFMFTNETFESIMAKVGRWYNVEIEFADPELKKKTFFGSISRFENISEVLKMLERTDLVTFEVGKEKVRIHRKN
ncbi:MAG: FecR domain-containing protein [Mucilaginibacter sp.]|uniref:FecR family protein n=1 Tax=Mucilaginibacter sp. TaxID=1882438 RepID=UPI00326567FC